MEGTLSKRRGLKRAITPNEDDKIILLILTSTLEGFNVLGSLSKLSNSLDESNSGFLIGFEGSKNGSGHFIKLGFKL